MGDDFSNVNLKAREKGLHWWSGKLVIHWPNMVIFCQICILTVMETREDEFSDHLNNQATFSGCTALHYACIVDDAGKHFTIIFIIYLKCKIYCLLACVAALLDGGCNPSLTNLGGHKPIEYANSDAMKKLIESYTVKVFCSYWLCWLWIYISC